MPKKKAAAKKLNKSAFIRNFPSDTPAVDIVTKAKAAGLKLTPAFVHAVRSRAKDKAPRKGRAGRKPSNGGATASDFIRSQPATMKARDIVAAGAKQGLEFSANLVYMVRSKSGAAPASGGRRSARGSAPGAGGTESEFRRLAIGIGLGRARQLLDGLERRLAELIG